MTVTEPAAPAIDWHARPGESLETYLVRRYAGDDARRAAMIREHLERRERYRTVEMARLTLYRREFRQRYGFEPPSRPYPEDDYAGRFSGFTEQGAQMLRALEWDWRRTQPTGAGS